MGQTDYGREKGLIIIAFQPHMDVDITFFNRLADRWDVILATEGQVNVRLPPVKVDQGLSLDATRYKRILTRLNERDSSNTLVFSSNPAHLMAGQNAGFNAFRLYPHADGQVGFGKNARCAMFFTNQEHERKIFVGDAIRDVLGPYELVRKSDLIAMPLSSMRPQ